MPFRRRLISLVIALAAWHAAPIVRAQNAQLDPIQYTFRVASAAKHVAEIEARIPTGGQPSIDLMMPVWTPGYYVVEDYAGRVQDLVARGVDGTILDTTKPQPNRWRIQTNRSPVVVLTYKLLCQGRSVTSNWVDADLGVINGGAAFITLAENVRRPARRHDRTAAHVEVERERARTGARGRIQSLPRGRLRYPRRLADRRRRSRHP